MVYGWWVGGLVGGWVVGGGGGGGSKKHVTPRDRYVGQTAKRNKAAGTFLGCQLKKKTECIPVCIHPDAYFDNLVRRQMVPCA